MIFWNQKTGPWSTFRPENSRVHVWHASLEQPEEVVQKLEAVLSAEERQRADRIRDQDHRRSFIVSRGILRNLLSRYTGLKPEKIQFKFNMAGKPFLAGLESVPEIHFNLSHSNLLALYAFSWERQVGIDVECIRQMEEMDQVAQNYFTPSEYKTLQSVSEKDKLRAFYNCWTRKEAFIKAVGDGLSFPLQEFGVTIQPDQPAELVMIHGSHEGVNRWTLHDLKSWEGYTAALVVEGKTHSLSHKQWTYTQFL